MQEQESTNNQRKSNLSDSELIDAGACPNCWGHQEYDGQYTQYVADQTKSAINHEKTGKKSFIAQFVEDRITGIKLKRDNDKLSCPKCNSTF